MKNADDTEIQKFNAWTSQWWERRGALASLHDINPLRLGYIQKRCPLAGLRVVDVGCGGGILSEAMACAGAKVTGIDLGAGPIAAARAHAAENGRDIVYVQSAVEDFLDREKAGFDLVTCMELLEHVPDPARLVRACAGLARPGGHVFFATLNRTFRSYVLAILAAEYLLRLLPVGTHQHRRFIRPRELSAWAGDAGLTLKDVSGFLYLPLFRRSFLTRDAGVNYLMHLIRPPERAFG